MAIQTGAFGISILIWTLWFTTHLPWMGVPESVSLPIILITWLAATTFFAGRSLDGCLKRSTALGLVTALIGLLLVGSKLVEDPSPGSVEAGAIKPNAALIAVGFLALGAGIGVVGGLLSRVVPGAQSKRGYAPLETSSTNRDWLARLALVTVAAICPLLLIGGLVTSTNSGMAVVDWPNTFGSNMFLYPLGPRAAPDVFLEHSHRLFGIFVGLCVIVLLVCTLIHEPRKGVRYVALAVLALVIVQGVIGGLRVREGNIIHELDNRYNALIHGILGQIFLALTVVLAAKLSAPARYGDGRALALSNPKAVRVRKFATQAMHATVLQLVLGAVYRHLRDGKGGSHALMAHMAFSLIVVVAAVMAGFAAAALRKPDQKSIDDPLARSLHRTGGWVLAVVALQFMLGWVTWLLGGKTHNPDHVWQAVLRTAHQGNGALLLALTAWMSTLGKQIPRLPNPVR